MSAFKLRAHRGIPPPPPPPSSGLTLVDQPEMSGIPREGKAASIWAGSYSGGTPTHYRFKIYRDSGAGPVLVGTIVQTTEEYAFTWASADAETLASATVEASADNQATWTAAVEPYYSFYPDTQLIEPAAIAQDSAITRTSAAGAALTFDVTATILPSYMWQIKVYDQDFLTLKYEGIKAVSDTELTSPFTPDFSGATGPSPDPAMSALLVTDILVMRFITQDWMESPNPADSGGAAGPWMAVSRTDFGGNRYWKLLISSAVGGVDGGMVANEIELAESVGGPDLAQAKNYSVSPGHLGADAPGGSTFSFSHFFDGVFSTKGALSNAVSLPGYIIIDMLIPRPLAQLRITHESENYLSAPATFTFGPCLANGTYIGSPPVSVTGQAWSSTVDETKTWSF